MHSIGDFERISDHAINLVDAAREMQKKEQTFSPKALEELETFSRAVSDIVDMSVNIFEKEDVEEAKHVEPFEEAIDVIQKEMKKRQSVCVRASVQWSLVLYYLILQTTMRELQTIVPISQSASCS